MTAREEAPVQNAGDQKKLHCCYGCGASYVDLEKLGILVAESALDCSDEMIGVENALANLTIPTFSSPS